MTVIGIHFDQLDVLVLVTYLFELVKKPVTGGLQNISPKVMAMIVLLAVMGILWGRVLLKGKGGPAATNAQDQAIVQVLSHLVGSKGKVVAFHSEPFKDLYEENIDLIGIGEVFWILLLMKQTLENDLTAV